MSSLRLCQQEASASKVQDEDRSADMYVHDVKLEVFLGF